MRAIAANEGRYPISAQCRLLGVARSAYYSMRSRPDRPAAPDPAAPAVVAVHAASKGRYGSRKIKGVAREVGRHRQPAPGLPHHEGERPGRRIRREEVQGAPRGALPRTHICCDLACVRVGSSWNYVCLLVDLCNREIVGHSAGPRKDARLVKSAFATLSFPISDIEVFHADRGSEFDNAEIDLMLEAFGIETSLSAKGRPYDNAVDESTNRILKAELVHRETFGTTRELRAKPSDYAAPIRQLQDPLDAGPHVACRVQEGGTVPPEIVQIGVANPGSRGPAKIETVETVISEDRTFELKIRTFTKRGVLVSCATGDEKELEKINSQVGYRLSPVATVVLAHG